MHRTHRVNLDWVYEVINSEAIVVQYVNTHFQLADILTKGFTNAPAWTLLLRLAQLHRGTYLSATFSLSNRRPILKSTPILKGKGSHKLSKLAMLATFVTESASMSSQFDSNSRHECVVDSHEHEHEHFHCDCRAQQHFGFSLSLPLSLSLSASSWKTSEDFQKSCCTMAPKHSKELSKNFDGSGRDTPETFSWKQKALARQRRAVSVDEMSDVDYDSLPTASATIRAASLTPSETLVIPVHITGTDEESVSPPPVDLPSQEVTFNSLPAVEPFMHPGRPEQANVSFP